MIGCPIGFMVLMWLQILLPDFCPVCVFAPSLLVNQDLSKHHACSLMVFVKWFLWFEAHCFHNPWSYTRFQHDIYHSSIHQNSGNSLSDFQKTKLYFEAIRILHFHSMSIDVLSQPRTSILFTFLTGQ